MSIFIVYTLSETSLLDMFTVSFSKIWNVQPPSSLMYSPHLCQKPKPNHQISFFKPPFFLSLLLFCYSSMCQRLKLPSIFYFFLFSYITLVFINLANKRIKAPWVAKHLGIGESVSRQILTVIVTFCII